MGEVYKVHCPKCGYETSLDLGVGFDYPQFYAEMQEDGKCGKLGNDIKDFFAEYTDGVIDPVPMITQCDECGEYDTAPSLKMYVPDKSKEPRRKSNVRWSVVMPFHELDYVSPEEFEAHYKLYKEHQHICKKCGGKIRMISEDNIRKLKCPHCKDIFLSVDIEALWD